MISIQHFRWDLADFESRARARPHDALATVECRAGGTYESDFSVLRSEDRCTPRQAEVRDTQDKVIVLCVNIVQGRVKESSAVNPHVSCFVERGFIGKL